MSKGFFLRYSALLCSSLALSGCGVFSSHTSSGLPKGVEISITSYGGLQTVGELPKGMSINFDNYGRIHLSEGKPIVHSQFDDEQERINEGFDSPVSGKSSEWPLYIMKTSLSCSNDLDKSETGVKDFVSPISQYRGASIAANLIQGMSLTTSGNVFIDYSGRSHFVFGFFANGLGVKTGSIIFQPKLGVINFGTYDFFVDDHKSCLGRISLYPGPKMISYLTWLQNNGRFPEREDGDIRDDANPNFYDPINPLHGGYGRKIGEHINN